MTANFSPWCPLVVSLSLPLLLSGCAGMLADGQTAKRMRGWYEGFPPMFSDATLNQYRARYQADKARYDADPRAFLGLDSPANGCRLEQAAAEQLATSGYRPRTYQRSPGHRESVKRLQDFQPLEVFDGVSVKVLAGQCAGGRLHGDATLVMNFVHLSKSKESPNFREPGYPLMDFYEVAEVSIREECQYRQGVRHGFCVRYARHKTWEGRQSKSGELLPWAEADYRDGYSTERPGNSRAEIVTTFDYGMFDNGLEVGDGVAFETMPFVFTGGKHQVLENGTLVRQNTADGRVRYTEYMGDDPMRGYLLRQGVAEGLHQEYIDPVFENVREICFRNGQAILTAQCGV